MQTININTNKGINFFNINNIIRVQGISNYCKIYFVDKSQPIVVAKVLHWFEENLPVEKFWRTHKSHLVNNEQIEKMNTSQKPFLIMANGEVLQISRRRVSQVKKRSEERRVGKECSS